MLLTRFMKTFQTNSVVACWNDITPSNYPRFGIGGDRLYCLQSTQTNSTSCLHCQLLLLCEIVRFGQKDIFRTEAGWYMNIINLRVRLHYCLLKKHYHLGFLQDTLLCAGDFCFSWKGLPDPPKWSKNQKMAHQTSVCNIMLSILLWFLLSLNIVKLFLFKRPHEWGLVLRCTQQTFVCM